MNSTIYESANISTIAADSGYCVEQGDFGPRLVLQGDWKDEFLDYMLENGIKEINVNYARGFNGTSLDFLQSLPFLEGLLLLVYHIPDIAVVQKLHKLRSFIDGCRDKTPINFAQFPALEKCGMSWRKESETLFECSNLKWLYVSGYPNKNADSFGQLAHLSTLNINTAQIQDLAGLRSLNSLRLLSLYRLNNLTSLAGIVTLITLEILEIQTCRKLTDIEDIRFLTGLNQLNVCNCGEIASLKPISFLPSLKTIGFIGTNIVDGNLPVLAESASLENYIFNNKRHYSHSRKDLLQIRESRLLQQYSNC